jgi:hypothetical protein
MNNVFSRFVSRILIVSLFCLPLQAGADLVATDQAVPAVQATAAQVTAARIAIATRLESLGIGREAARERVAALSNAEALSLADRVGSAPAGAGFEVTIAMLIVVAFLIWRFGFSDQAKAESGKK